MTWLMVLIVLLWISIMVWAATASEGHMIGTRSFFCKHDYQIIEYYPWGHRKKCKKCDWRLDVYKYIPSTTAVKSIQ